MLKNYIYTALRNLVRFKTNSIINIIGLSLGFATSIIIVLYVIHEFQVDKFNKNIDRIYRIELGEEKNRHAYMPEIVARKISEEIPEVEKFVRFDFGEDNNVLKYKENTWLLQDFAFADSSIFDIFTFPFIQGSPLTALKQPFSLVLTESTAKKIFGSEDPINKIVKYKNYYDFTITGIIKGIKNFHLSINALASFESLSIMNGGGNLGYNSWSYPSYLMLRNSNYDVKSIENKIYSNFKQTDYWKENEPKFKLNKLSDVYFSRNVPASHTKYGNLQFIFILITICIFTLILACINFINLETSKSLVKQKEIRIRKILGAKTFHFYKQLYFEILILSLIGGLLAYLFVDTVQPFLSSILGTDFSLDQLYSFNGVFVSAIIILFMSIVVAIPPAFKNSSNNYEISNQFVIQKKSITSKKLLILFQFSISIVLIVATAFTYKQLQFLKNSNLGFDKENVIIVRLNSNIVNNEGIKQTLKEKLLSNPGIIGVSYACLEPGASWWSTNVEIDGKKIEINENSIDPDYFNVLKPELISGRNFSWDNKSDVGKTYILNECAVKLWGLKYPVGKLMKGDTGDGTIIGIAKDFHFNSLHSPILPLVFYYNPGMYKKVLIRILPQNASESLKYIQKVWKEISPDFPIDYWFLDKTFDANYKSDENFSNLLMAFSLLAILIACLGIFGLSSFIVKQRTKEIGIRKINGARVSEILVMLNGDLIKWVAISFVIACPIAWYAMHKWLLDFAYKTELSWWVFILAGLLTLGITLLTVSWLSWRASTKNPVEALRYE